MRPIVAQLCTVETNRSNQLDHSGKWITAGDGSRPERDRGCSGIAATEGLWPEMDDKMDHSQR
jgi:hypothetical protein